VGDKSVSGPLSSRKEMAADGSSGNSDLEEPIAIRPTSETAMYPCMFSYFRLFIPLLIFV